LFFAATRKRPPAAGASAGSGGPGLSSEEFKMSDKETTRIAPTLKVALLSGAMGIALVGCGQALDGDPVALPPVADMVTADGPDVAGAPAPIAPGHPDRGTVGGGPGTGAWQSDDQTIATGEIGTFTDDVAVDPTDDATVAAEGEPTVGADGQVTTPGDVATDDVTTVDAEGAPTVGADGQVTTPGGVATDDDTTVEAEGAPAVGADGQVTTPGDVATDDGADAADGAGDS
jgi:hypothetical protein